LFCYGRLYNEQQTGLSDFDFESMYDKRVKIFAAIMVFFVLMALVRLAWIQLLPDSKLQDSIAELRLARDLSQQLKTVRGKILDRKGRILAEDQLQFQVHINYKLSCFLDERVRRAKLLKAAAKKENSQAAVLKVQKELDEKFEDLQQVTEKCTNFGTERQEILNRIKKINDEIWNLRTFIAWRRYGISSAILEKYNNRVEKIPRSVAIADFEQKFPNEEQRLLDIGKVDGLLEMNQSWPLLELENDDDIFTAQLEFLDIDGIQILPEGHRFYYYGSSAAQTIGWVGPATQEQDREMFESDKLSSYLSGEVCGREDGVEYVCEALLRGRRGEVIYDIDGKLLSSTETQFGRDVLLTLDIELQKRIENHLADCEQNKNCQKPTAAVVMDVESGDILSLVSMPSFDLNSVRQKYAQLAGDGNKPMLNRAINQTYPPGSATKPLILIAAMESGKVTTGEIIHCPAEPAPKGWPNCLQFSQFHSCHDQKWDGQGGNKARNAIKGSCNIYFSHLADRIDPGILQNWLFNFGYGHTVLFPPAVITNAGLKRNFRQAQGQISNKTPDTAISTFEDIGPLESRERRFFGIGQGNLRVTPLQVANAMSAIARGGKYKPARLIIDDSNDSIYDTNSLNISPQTIATVLDGMSAVVNESGGTAYNEFSRANFGSKGVKVYGKTGSTENPEHAWFAGFAQDGNGRSIAISVIVEGGQHGSSDAAPLARDIIAFCIEAGYIGR